MKTNTSFQAGGPAANRDELMASTRRAAFLTVSALGILMIVGTASIDPPPLAPKAMIGGWDGETTSVGRARVAAGRSLPIGGRFLLDLRRAVGFGRMDSARPSAGRR